MGDINSTDATRYELGPSTIEPSKPIRFNTGRTKYNVDEPVIPNIVHIINASVGLSFQFTLSFVVHDQNLFMILLSPLLLGPLLNRLGPR